VVAAGEVCEEGHEASSGAAAAEADVAAAASSGLSWVSGEVHSMSLIHGGARG
jgi:hypothetical protein